MTDAILGRHLAPLESEVELRPKMVSVTSQTLVELFTDFPAGVDYVGQFALVSDLYDSWTDYLCCVFDGVDYFWVPRFLSAITEDASTSGLVTLTVLETAPLVLLTDDLTNDLELALSSDNAWLGAKFEIWTPGDLATFDLELTGLAGAATLLLTADSKYTVVYTASGWKV